MSFFNKFPSIVYTFDFPDGPKVIRVKDIALNIRIRRALLDQVTVYDEYDIEDGETFDSISYRLYGSHSYHWVLMLLNERYNYLEDLPRSEYELKRHTEYVYGPGQADMPYTVNSVYTLPFDSAVGYNSDQYYEVVNNTAGITDGNNRVYGVKTAGQRYYTDSNGNVVLQVQPERFAVLYPDKNYDNYYRSLTSYTNFEYESMLNEKKRRIKVLNKNTMQTVVRQLERLFNV